MAGSSPLDVARGLEVKGRGAMLQKLILDGFFASPVTSEEIVLRIRETFGKRWKTSLVQVYLARFMTAGVVRSMKVPGKHSNHYVVTDIPRAEAMRQIAKGQKIQHLEEDLFSPELMARLRGHFSGDLQELHDNFGKNGNSTAFLLRKILEKLIIIVFGKNGREVMLQDKSRPGGWVGLEAMIDRAVAEKVGGMPFLLGKTAKKIEGIKFLGDTAAHNPLVDVDMQTIIPQMPFIVTAYKELSARL